MTRKMPKIKFGEVRLSVDENSPLKLREREIGSGLVHSRTQDSKNTMKIVDSTSVSQEFTNDYKNRISASY